MNPSDKIQLDRNEPITWNDYLHINAKVITPELASDIARHLDSIGIYHYRNIEPAYTIQKVRVCPRCGVEFVASYGSRFISVDGDYICEHCFLGVNLDKEFRAILDDTTHDVCNELSQETGTVPRVMQRKFKQEIAKGFSKLIQHIQNQTE